MTTMEVKRNVKSLMIDLNKDVKGTVNLKRKRASQYAAYLTSVAAKGAGPAKKRGKTEVAECCQRECKCWSRKDVLGNCGNFRKSSLPARVMYFRKGEWNDFPVNILPTLKEVFQTRKSAVEVTIDGSSYLVDFLRMVQIDLENGMQRSIAWIDENDKCFFPSVVVEGNHCYDDGEGNSEKAQQIEVKVEIGIRGSESSNSENYSEVSATHIKSQSPEVQHQMDCTDSGELEQDSSDTHSPTKVFPVGQTRHLVNGIGDASASEALSKCANTSGTLGFGGLLGDRLIKLEEGEHEFESVREKFFAGLWTLVTFSRIVGIYQILPSSSAGQARMEAFQNHVKITRELRGNANVRYAWYGTSRKGVAGVIMHGFGQVRTPKSGAIYGTGVYLAPENCSRVSAAYSDVDENGEQHMVLCRVIMGNMEQVKPGSQQFHPCSEHFDSGVDNKECPKCYIVWSTHMNTHIHPEYVVSFKISPAAHEYWSGWRAKFGMHGFLQQGSTCEMARIPQSPVSVKESQSNMQVPADVPVKMPTSAWLPFPMLFYVIGKKLPSSTMGSLERHYADFKKRKITREDLIKRVRMIAGDQLLIDAIKNIKNQTSLSGPSEIQGQSLNSPNTTVNAQQFSCKDELTSHNAQAQY